MPRPNFTTTIRGNLDVTRGDGVPLYGGVCLDAKKASEVSVGITRRKPSGWIPPVAYSFTRTRYDRAQGHSNVTPGTNPVDWTMMSGTVGGDTPSGAGRFNSLNHFDEVFPVPTYDEAMRDRALIKARLAVKGQSINLGVAYAERSQTARLVGDTATNLAKAIRNLRKGNVRRAMNDLGISHRKGEPRGSSVPSKWLELQYGWKPMLSDVYGACEGLAYRDRTDWCITMHGRERQKIHVDKDIKSDVTCWYRGRAEGWQGCHVRIDAVPENELLQSFVSMGITNPLLIGWELVPFSFVADWFLPVGDYLDSLDAMLGYGPTWCSISEFWKVNWRNSSSPFNEYTPFGSFKISQDWEEKKEVVNLRRQTSESVPLPSFPRFKDPRSLGHMANGIGLLTQLFSKR